MEEMIKGTNGVYGYFYGYSVSFKKLKSNKLFNVLVEVNGDNSEEDIKYASIKARNYINKRGYDVGVEYGISKHTFEYRYQRGINYPCFSNKGFHVVIQ